MNSAGSETLFARGGVSRRDFLKLASGASLSLAGPSRAQQGGGRPPNFVVLFADDLGYSDVACYGHPTIRTPHLDRMAAQGIRFTSFYAAASVCTPSRAGLLTGRYPVRAGQPNNLGPDSKGGLPLGEITLAQHLKKAGYKTAAIGKWHLGHNPPEYLPTNRGFDSYLGLLYSNDMIRPWVQTDRPLELYRDDEPVEQVGDQSTLTERFTAEATRFIRSANSSPFFLYLPYPMPHLPVSASDRFRGRSRAGLYGDVIETLDWSAGEILSTLKQLGLDENTLVVFTSDNGPWLNLPERMLQKGIEPWHAGTKGMLRGAKATTYEGGFRVPCIARWPGVIPEGQATAEIASTLDLFPTLATAAGARVSEDRTYDGADILPLMRGHTAPRQRTFYYFNGRTLEAVREGKWKLRLAHRGAPGAGSGPVTPELYNLDVDPGEQYNQHGRYPQIAKSLQNRVHAFAGELSAETAV
jgi:arylsulfatase A